ncbi:MAG: M14 family metallopeptidase [Pseudomonas sp.]
MSNDRDLPVDDQRLSDASARRLLERAIALDAARVGETTVAELRRVALELNISPTAFGEALRELQTVTPAQPKVEPLQPAQATEPAPRKRNWWRTLGIGLGSFALAALNAAETSQPEFTIALLFFGSLALIVKHHRETAPGEFELDIVALSLGVTLPWVMSGDAEMAYVAAMGFLASTTLGGLLVRFRWPWKRVSAPDTRATGVALVLVISAASALSAQRITSPKEQFGHNFGDDYFLANYQQISAYWHKLDAESERMIVREIGKTAEGRPHLMAIVTSPENQRNLARYQDISRRLALAEGVTEQQARALAREGKAVVWIDGGLHASETLGAQQLGEMVYQMVSGNDEETLRLLNDVVILFVHANPDGNDLVADWYMRRSAPEQRSTGSLPRLYQKYIGHDNNRDFFGSTQAETENMNRVLYHDWLPQLLYNHHQSGPAGTVVWSPPLRDPYNYNLHPMLVLGFQSLGAAMHTRLAAENKPGATMRSGGPYDGWWNGGIRNTAAFHNVIALLTEMIGSPTPMRIPFVAQRQVPSADLAFPIAPQEWHFRQSVDYSVTLNRAVLDYASRMRENLLYNIYVMGKSSIDRGSGDYWTANPRRIADVAAKASGNEGGGRGGRGAGGGQLDASLWTELRTPALRDARAYVIPANQPDFPTAVKFINALRETNVAVQRATAPFEVQGKRYPAGSFVVFTAQAFRPHVMDMFEPQAHPDVFPYPGAPPTPPYDNAGWTLALQMGVQFDRILEGFQGPFTPVTDWNLPMPPGTVSATGRVAGYVSSREVNNAHIAVNRLQAAGEEVWALSQPLSANSVTFAPGTFFVRARGSTRGNLDRIARELGVSFTGVAAPAAPAPLRKPRIGLWDQ